MFEPKNFVELCSAMQQNTRVSINKIEGKIRSIGTYDSTRIFQVHIEDDEKIMFVTRFVDPS